jgi:XTP/dITP diphosphohydrolase
MGMPKLLLATNNPGKLAEFQTLLAGCGWELVTPADLGVALSGEEVGQTCEENARMKALEAAEASGLWALADDSGLEVEALGNEPGPLSARFGGEEATYPEKMALLLERMRGVPPQKRKCRFVCVIAIAEPSAEVRLCQGACRGLVAEEPRGEGGFGYDPIFYLSDMARTMAQLSEDEKNAISHRGRAARMARQMLEELLYDQREETRTSRRAD